MENERPGPSINEAMNELAGIEAMMHPTGAVDAETGDLNRIREQLASGNVSPAEAIAQARAMMAGRQDYH